MAAAVLAGPAFAGDWGLVANISSTLGANGNRLCLGEGTRKTDIGCPTYAPYIDPATGFVGIGTTSPTQPLDIKVSSGSQMRLEGDATAVTFRAFDAGAGDSSYLYISPLPSTVTGGAVVSFFRDTSTSAPVGLVVQKGNNSTTGNAYIAGNGDSYLAANNGNVGIGTSSPTTALEVNGTVSASNVYVTATTGTVSATYGYFKYISATNGLSGAMSESLALNDLTDVSASASAGTIMAGPSVPMSTDASRTTAFGAYAFGGATAVGYGNSAFGYRTLFSNAGGYYNSAIGGWAMYSNTTGIYNTAVGLEPLYYNTTGSYNTALGTLALFTNTTGQQNVGVGVAALEFNTTGNNNVALGSYAGRGVSGSTVISNSVLIGYAAGISLTTGGNNTLVGFRAGDRLSTGGNNTLLGLAAGDNLTTGSNNIILGYNVDAGSATGSYQLNIGNALYGNIGSGMGNANLIGINVSSPTTALEVAGTVSATRFVGDGSGLTGIAASGDRIVSGSVSAVAEVASGRVAVSGTLALLNSGNEPCDANKYYSLRVNPATGAVQICRP
jgi:hypothetical protein